MRSARLRSRAGSPASRRCQAASPPPARSPPPRATEPAEAGAAAMTGPGTLELHFLIEDVGPGTNRLAELEPGGGLRIVGPLGLGFTAPAGTRAPLLVGGGVGIAPLAIWQDQL